MEPYSRRQFKKNIVSLAVVNRQLYPCELLTCDRDFLLENLPGNKHLREQVKAHYRHEWLEGMKSEKIPFKRQNTGRRRANNWLRTHWRKGYPIK